MSDEASAFLAHYGVKGMHWGSRKSRQNFLKISQEPNSHDHDAVKTLRAKPVSKLSNEDLKKVNARLQLEKTYTELSQNGKSLKRGQKTVDNILSNANKANQVYTLYNSPMAKAIKTTIESQLTK